MQTIDIKGKRYVTVNERLKYFRENFAGYSLTSEVIELTDKRVVIKAIMANSEGVIVANGLAYENADSSFINKTSYIENCETSAWGRALGNFGIGVDVSVASADEVVNAIENQKPKKTPIKEFKGEIKLPHETKPTASGDLRVEMQSTLYSLAKECGISTKQFDASIKTEFGLAVKKLNQDQFNNVKDRLVNKLSEKGE